MTKKEKSEQILGIAIALGVMSYMCSLGDTMWFNTASSFTGIASIMSGIIGLAVRYED